MAEAQDAEHRSEAPSPRRLQKAREYETGAARMDPAIHTHVFGRPTGMAIFQRIMQIAKAADDIWIGTRSEAVTQLRAVMKSR